MGVLTQSLNLSEMALTDFFRINMPYGLRRNEKGEWFTFNREYKPLGFKTNDRVRYEDYPIFVKYKGLTDGKIKKLAIPESLAHDEKGNVYLFCLYDDATNPHDNPKHFLSPAIPLVIVGFLLCWPFFCNLVPSFLPSFSERA